MEFKNKNIIVTGANGLVGLPTVGKCLEEGAHVVFAVDINIGEELIKLRDQYPALILMMKDLTYLDNCKSLFNTVPIDIVLHIAGV